jgi:cell division protease FtsH
MVTKYGMSEAMGPLQIGRQEDNVFLGREISERRDYSEEVAEQVDEEVRRIVSSAYQRVRQMLSTYRSQLDNVAEALLERETMEADEFTEVFEGRDTNYGQGIVGPITPQPV